MRCRACGGDGWVTATGIGGCPDDSPPERELACEPCNGTGDLILTSAAIVEECELLWADARSPMLRSLLGELAIEARDVGRLAEIVALLEQCCDYLRDECVPAHLVAKVHAFCTPRAA